jgi:serine/threonine-protein kinase
VDSQKLDPGIGTLLNLALCYEKSGKTASAWTTYRDAAAMARKQGDSEREKFARDEVERLDALVVKVAIEVSPESKDIEGLEILRDGTVVRKTLWGVPVPVDPGEITVEVRAPGYAPISETVEARQAGSTVEFRVPPLVEGDDGAPTDGGDSAASSESPGEVSPPPKQSDQRSSAGPGPWILGGVGLAAVAAGGVFGAMTLGSIGAADDICPDQAGDGTASGPCTSDDVADYDYYTNRARSFRTISYIGFGVGGAALIGAATWMILGKPKSESALRVEPRVGDPWGLQARGTF